MARTYRRAAYHESDVWGTRRGRWYKRQLHKAERRALKGTGKPSSVIPAKAGTPTVNWKGT
jgi:hypothetical protein